MLWLRDARLILLVFLRHQSFAQRASSGRIQRIRSAPLRFLALLRDLGRLSDLRFFVSLFNLRNPLLGPRFSRFGIFYQLLIEIEPHEFYEGCSPLKAHFRMILGDFYYVAFQLFSYYGLKIIAELDVRGAYRGRKKRGLRGLGFWKWMLGIRRILL